MAVFRGGAIFVKKKNRQTINIFFCHSSIGYMVIGDAILA